MRPLASITEAFSLIIQEKCQQFVSVIAPFSDSELAFAVKSQKSNFNPKAKSVKKDRSQHAHCGLVTLRTGALNCTTTLQTIRSNPLAL